MRRPVRLLVLAAGAVALLGILVLSGCVDSLEPDLSVDPHAPAFAGVTTDVTYPSQLATVILTWSCSDPDNDPITYTLLFGLDRNGLMVIVSGYTGTTASIGGLEPGKTWYWQVIATDSTGKISVSQVEQFKTASGPIYPLRFGNEWNYRGSVWSSDYDFAPVPPTLLDSITGSAHVVISGAQWVGDTVLTSIMHETDSINGDEFESRVWLANRADGMYDYAESGFMSRALPLKLIVGGSDLYGSVTLPYTPGAAFGLRGLLPATGAGADQDVVIAPPRRSLAYPLTVGQFWIVFNDGNLMVKKLVTDSVQIVTPAGTFDALEVTWRYYWVYPPPPPWTALDDGPEGGRVTQVDDPDIEFLDPNIVIRDYIASIGLVKRTVRSTNVTVTDFTSDSLGTCTFHEEWVLQNYSTMPPERSPEGFTVELGGSE